MNIFAILYISYSTKHLHVASRCGTLLWIHWHCKPCFVLFQSTKCIALRSHGCDWLLLLDCKALDGLQTTASFVNGPFAEQQLEPMRLHWLLKPLGGFYLVIVSNPPKTLQLIEYVATGGEQNSAAM